MSKKTKKKTYYCVDHSSEFNLKSIYNQHKRMGCHIINQNSPNPEPTTPRKGGKWVKDPDRSKRKGKPVRLTPEEEQLIKDHEELKKKGKDLVKLPCRTCGKLSWTPVDGKKEDDPVDTLCVACYLKVSKKVTNY